MILLENAELDNLWRELAESKEENGFITLPKGLEELFPLVKKKLMVRECYRKLVSIVEERSNVQLLGVSQLGDSEMEDATIAGMPLEKGYVGGLSILNVSYIWIPQTISLRVACLHR